MKFHLQSSSGSKCSQQTEMHGSASGQKCFYSFVVQLQLLHCCLSISQSPERWMGRLCQVRGLTLLVILLNHQKKVNRFAKSIFSFLQMNTNSTFFSGITHITHISILEQSYLVMLSNIFYIITKFVRTIYTLI